MSDVFHNGEEVLQDVLHWHKYLREAARQTDIFSAAVLDMVDNHMLVASERRWKAEKVCEEFERILKLKESKTSEVPPELLDLLQSIDLEVERTYDHNSGIKRPDATETTKRLKDIKIPPPDVEFESRWKLLDEEILPTAQRSRKLGEISATASRASLSLPSSKRATDASQRYERDGSVQRHISTSSRNHPLEMIASPVPMDSEDYHPQEEEPQRDIVTVWQVKQELEETGLKYRPKMKSLSSLFNKQKTTVKGKRSWGNMDDLDKQLLKQFKDRDLIFLVDNGSTMVKHWKQATELLEVLVWRVLGYDDNGMELYFTNPDTNPKAIVREEKSQTVQQFARAMDLGKPAKNGLVVCQTTIVPELERIVNVYTRAKLSKPETRKRTIIVLTDGIWEGMHDEYTLDVYLTSAFHGLRDIHGDLTYVESDQPLDREGISTIRPITIQFIQFGNDKGASERLRRLDDDLWYNGCP
ncbi:uncharacterized protein ColSpa_06762 [Colletotrichum spaethianum]|uniref:VWFA domain-containing protein n=1 Tax=Colletotrichum spaethianum TaxID=700344 RepID=A0AA37P6J6_9PEZI|nr:uncharacterized protein ColSpa_06762 [Colletotrichum spaethianum]GKT46581.1 hypothetical protein ColSpa_06762 [Colletotrichum spaethianum]